MSTTRDGMLCQLDGRGYVLDIGELAFASVDPTRQGVDQGSGAGSSSLSNQVVWRRVRDNFVGGAGQEYADLEGEDASSEIRFSESVGVEVFDRRKLHLRPPPVVAAAPPMRIDSGTAFQITGSTLLDQFAQGHATNPYSKFIACVTADWDASTVAPGIIIASGDTLTEARWRLRFVSTSVGNGRLYLDLNTTGSGTTYDETFVSPSTAINLAAHDVIVWDFQLYESGSDIVCEFGFQEYSASAGTHPAQVMVGAAHASMGSDTATGKSLPTWASPQMTVGKGPNVGSSGYVGDACIPWVLAFSVDDAVDVTTSNRPSPHLDAYNLNCAFMDGMCWRTSDTLYEPQYQQINDAYIGSEAEAVTVTIVAGDVDPPTSASFSETNVVPYTANYTAESAVYVIGPFGAMRRSLIGSDDYGGTVTFVNEPYYSITKGMYDGTDHQVADVVTPFDDGFLCLMYTGGSLQDLDIWIHDGSTWTSYLAGTFDMLAAVGSRVVCGDGNILYELTSMPGTTTIYTHPRSLFEWAGGFAAPGGVYVWGSDGGATEIYRLPIDDATGAMGAPIPAGSLPFGERIYGMVEHEGIILIASYKGFRIALLDSDGSLVFGALLETETGDGVTSVCAFGRFAYGTVASVAGEPIVYKYDLSRFVEPDSLIPAYEALAPWVDPDGIDTYWDSSMVNPYRSTIVTSTSASGPIFAGANQCYLLGNTLTKGVAGTIDLGWFTYGIGEMLAFDSITVECEPADGAAVTVTVHVDTPDEDDVVTATSTLAPDPVFTVRHDGDLRARRFRVRLTLTPDTVTPATPVVRQVVLKAVPAPDMSDEMLLPIILQDSVETEHGQASAVDVWEEWSHLIDLRNSRQPVTLRIGSYERTVRIEGLEVRGGGLGGGNGLLGYDRDDEFLAGRWNVRIITLD